MVGLNRAIDEFAHLAEDTLRLVVDADLDHPAGDRRKLGEDRGFATKVKLFALDDDFLAEEEPEYQEDDVDQAGDYEPGQDLEDIYQQDRGQDRALQGVDKSEGEDSVHDTQVIRESIDKPA